MDFSLTERISKTPTLAMPPATTLRLLDLLAYEDGAAEPIREVIELDPTLSAHLLKLCNSAYYGMRRRIATVHEALVLLGNRTVITLAFAASMERLLRKSLAWYRVSPTEMWHHSLATALGASYLISRSGGSAEDELKGRAFLAGLVHDIGKLVLEEPLREHPEELAVDVDFQRMRRTERRILGCDHCEAGAALATAWGFPEPLVEAIERHHDESAVTTTGDIAAAVRVADLVANALEIDCGGRADVDLDDLADKGVGPWSGETVAELASRVEEDLERLIGIVTAEVT